MYLGRWDLDDLLTFSCSTSNPYTAVAVDADSVPTYRVYEDETGTAILTGSMALLDSANTDGQYSKQITLSAANGFEVGKTYTIRIAATVGGVAGATVRTFQVEAATALESSIANIQGRLPAALVSGRMDSSIGAVAAGVIAAASFAANALDAVWSATTRLLTAGTNIVLAKGTGVTGFNDLDAAGVRAAVGLASANLDTQIDALPTNAELATALGTADDAVLAAIAALNNLSQANVRSAVGLASANLDTQLGAIAGYIDTEIGSIISAIAALPTAAANEAAYSAKVLEGSLTRLQAERIVLAAVAGKASGLDTNAPVYRDTSDTKDRVVATTDVYGNRLSVTLDGS